MKTNMYIVCIVVMHQGMQAAINQYMICHCTTFACACQTDDYSEWPLP